MKKQASRHSGKPRHQAAKFVTLHRNGQYCEVIPPVEQLGQRFWTVWHEWVPNSAQVPQLTPIPSPLLWPQQDARGNPYWQCYAGMEPILQELLKDAGYQIQLTGTRATMLHAPSTASLHEFRTLDTGMLKFIRRRDRGLIRYDTQQVRPANLIAQIALAWKKARIVVVVGRINEASLLREQLRNWLPKVELFTGRKNPRRAARVTIASPAYLRVGAIGLERRSMLIVMDPAGLFSTSGADALKQAHKARVFGLLPEDVQIAPYIRGLMISLYGVREVTVPRHGYLRRPVTAIFQRTFGGATVPNHRAHVDLKKYGIWKHDLRNRRIVQIFKAIAIQDQQLITDKFPDLANIPPLESDCRVVLLVENVEHALAMAKRLPGTPVLTDMTKLWDEGLTMEQRALLEAGRAGAKSSKTLIVTVAAFAAAGDFDVLIRADGGIGKAPLSQRQLIAPDSAVKPLTVIDFDDKHHPLLRRWSRQRKDAYREQGWMIHGEPIPTDLERFLAALPEVTS